MPASPSCLVKDGAGSFVAPTNGVDVTPNNTISIKLVDTTGVNTWLLEVFGTDELSSSPTLAGVNSMTHQVTGPATIVTFTYPNAKGRALVFRSTVQSGSVSTSTTFILTSKLGVFRVGATRETIEGSSTFGWVPKLNSLIRSVSNRTSVSVKDFGAVGDGVTDDYTAIMAAIAFVGAAGGGSIFFPPGTYLTSNQILVAYDNVTIRGVRGATILKAKDACDFTVVLRGDNRTNVHFSDLEIDVNQANRSGVATTALDGCGFNTSDRCSGTNITVRNPYGPAGDCFAFGGCTNCEWVLCKAYNGNVAAHATDGFYMSGTSNRTIGCYVENCADTAGVIEAGNDCWHINLIAKNVGSYGAVTNTTNVDMQNNGFIGGSCDGWAATVTGALQIGSLIGSGNVLNTTIMGIAISNPTGGANAAVYLRKLGTGNVKSFKMIGCHIDGAGTQALNVDSGASDLHFSGNSFRSSQYAMLFAVGCSNVSILGNKLYPHTGGYGGIGISGAVTDFKISGNHIDCANGAGTAASYGANIAAGGSRIQWTRDNTIINNASTDIIEGTALDYVHVDLVGTQTVAGAKTWSNAARFSSTVQTDGAVSINGAIPSSSKLKVYAVGGTGAIAIQQTGGGTTGILFDDTGNYGFLDYDNNSGNGVRLSALASLRLGTNTNTIYGSSTFTSRAIITSAGVGITGSGVVASPTASIHIGAGQAAAGGAPIKLTSGTLLTSPENGAIEYTGSNRLTFTDGSGRRDFFLSGAAISLGGFAITNLATPSNGTDAATKAYVDSASAGAGKILQTLFSTLASDYTNSTTNFANGSATDIIHVSVTTTTGKLLVIAAVTGKMTGTSAGAILAITLNGVDYTIGALASASGTGEYQSATIEAYVTGLTPGTFSVQLRGKLDSSGTLNIRPSTDTPYARATLRIQEVG